jgi:hypothetical protein
MKEVRQMKNTRISLLTCLLIIALSPFFLTCAPSGGDATVNIKLGFAHNEASNRPVIDRILNFFATRAYAQPPANIGGITVRVEGPDMPTMEFDFELGLTTLTLLVPSGSARTFTVIAGVVPGDPSAALSFRGTATVDLAAGVTVNLSIPMIVGETKIVIPDYRNSRIVQIDDMSGAGWTPLIGSQMSGWSDIEFRPYDIDFDARGRIFIANNKGGSGMGANCVIRIDNISGVNAISFSEPEYDYGIVALAIDRKNNYVYYAVDNIGTGSYLLYRSDLDGLGQTGMSTSGITDISGMDIDANGIIYIAGDSGTVSYVPTVFRYDPVAQNVTASYGPGFLVTDWDVLVKSSNIYVSNLNSANDKRIILLNQNMEFVDSFGNAVAVPASPVKDEFYGPKRFVAILNKKIYVTDEEEFSSYARIVSFDDINGTNWTTYGSYGSGADQFLLYNTC